MIFFKIVIHIFKDFIQPILYLFKIFLQKPNLSPYKINLFGIIAFLKEKPETELFSRTATTKRARRLENTGLSLTAQGCSASVASERHFRFALMALHFVPGNDVHPDCSMQTNHSGRDPAFVADGFQIAQQAYVLSPRNDRYSRHGPRMGRYYCSRWTRHKRPATLPARDLPALHGVASIPADLLLQQPRRQCQNFP